MKKLPKIIFLDAATVDLGDINWRSLEALGKFVRFKNTETKSLATRCATADIIITNKVLMRDLVALKKSRLKLICASATGYNHIDVKAAKVMGIGVCNVPGYSTQTVAEHTLMFLLNLAHRFTEHHEVSLNGTWSRSSHFTVLDFPFAELSGKTLGIIGYGTIGKAVAKLAKAFGMQILLAQIPGRKSKDKLKRLTLNQVLQKSDFVTLHCALSEITKTLINDERLSFMKKSAYLLNVARGGIVDEVAIIRHLKQGTLAGYATDVLSQEPPAKNHPLLSPSLRHKVLLTPHIAWGSLEARQRLVDEMALNIKAYLQGKRRNRVE
jgi:glycerate dehydrogenase